MEQKKYYKQDLNKMTVYQLQEIARREKIIPAVVNRLDKQLLIKTILRYRGAENALLIKDYRAEDYERLENIFPTLTFQEQATNITCNARINVSQGLATDFFDNITVDYSAELSGTNAFIIDHEKNLCCVFNVEEKTGDSEYLYLRRSREFPCRESQIKNYYLILLEREYSQQFFDFYNGEIKHIQSNLPAYALQLLNFTVTEPEVLKMPVAIDFGTSATTAGILDFKQKVSVAKFHNENIKHAVFYDSEGNETNLMPTVVGVKSLKNPEQPEYLFGYDAMNFSASMDEHFTILYDIKRWIADYDKDEELTDSEGRRAFIPRKTILREFFLHVIRSLEDYVKGKVRAVHISGPVKQKGKFQYLFREILPDYAVEKEDMIDESVAVLYNTISELIESKSIRNRQKYSALVIDCGGGTTDISSCTFQVDNRRVSYAIDIETGYENGSTDFGGNNLTYRILQILKLKIVESIYQHRLSQSDLLKARQAFYGEKESLDAKTFQRISEIPRLKHLLQDFNLDVFRYIDENGVNSIYQNFEKAYALAEEILPTKFKLWETKKRSEYFRVRNNYYFLFTLATRIKREFFQGNDIFRVVLSAEDNHAKQEDTMTLPLDKWKLTLKNSEGLCYFNTLPDISFSLFEVETVLKPDIYNIIRQFFDPIYENGELENYGLIKLSGQSCKIDLFRTSLKEFVPGKLIKSKPKSELSERENELKMSCLNGALKYLRDKKFGYADIKIVNRQPHLPYILTGFSHTGEEIYLIDETKGKHGGVISRNSEDLALTVYLKDSEKNLRQEFIYECVLDEFEALRQSEIEKIYGDKIPQTETDTIVNGEVKFFVRVEPQDWGFVIIPVYREDEILFVGKEKFFNFENDSWVKNFFDGLK